MSWFMVTHTISQAPAAEVSWSNTELLIAYRVKDLLLIFPKVMSFQNIPALWLPEKGHDQDW